MRLNYHVGPVRTQMMNTQNMNISEMSMHKIPNFNVCSSDKSESKITNADKTLSYVCSMDECELKNVTVNACSLDESKSKSVHISVNTSEVEYEMNEKRMNKLRLQIV